MYSFQKHRLSNVPRPKCKSCTQTHAYVSIIACNIILRKGVWAIDHNFFVPAFQELEASNKLQRVRDDKKLITMSGLGIASERLGYPDFNLNVWRYAHSWKGMLRCPLVVRSRSAMPFCNMHLMLLTTTANVGQE